ncbi:MAG TPA: ABC transporter ATP-binding protein [Chromatiales bacterium]|nr:ABC transporter ATP-binding protein [Chromatiales bacterium]
MSLKAADVCLVLGEGNQQVTALDHVSIEVADGELVIVLGPSGAGKSSLLAVCGGLRTPTSGRVWIDGTEITGLDAAQLAELRRRRIGFVFQQSNLVPSLTAIDQLLLLAHLNGRRPDAADRERALALLDEVGMADKNHRRPGQMSGGERQRVGIARALFGQPALLLVDEPTSMLDRARGHRIVELLKQTCHEHEVATLLVTHDQATLDMADRVVEITDGRLTPYVPDTASAPAPAAAR